MRSQEKAGRVEDPGAMCGIANPTSRLEDQVDPSPASQDAQSKRRRESRAEVDTSAWILLINVGSRLRGQILDLSMGGCRIRTKDRFPVGIYTRVETEFRLEGLPFRLGGVIQRIYDHKTVGIRFIDLSERKRQQVSELIAEITESGTGESPMDPAAA